MDRDESAIGNEEIYMVLMIMATGIILVILGVGLMIYRITVRDIGD